MNKKALVFSKHAKNRVEELKTTEELVKKMFNKAERVFLRRSWKTYKLSKYRAGQFDVKYYFYNGWVFTVSEKRDYIMLITLFRASKRIFKKRKLKIGWGVLMGVLVSLVILRFFVERREKYV